MVAGKPVTQCSPFGTDGVDSVTAGTCFPCSHAAVKLAGYLCTDGETRLCPGGNYCPLNTTTGSYNVAIPCDVEGKICLPGFIAPVECRPGQLCKANATKIERSWGWLVAVLFITIVMCCMCCCVRFYSVREARLSQEAREAHMAPEEGHAIGEDFKEFCPAVDIEFQDVGMQLKKGGKEILSGVTGHFPVGSLIALMGPSGGGKTTFMNALLGRASYANVTGSIKVNGVEDGFRKARNLMGFVPQDDILHADLTVFQNLQYQALLRLPAGLGGGTQCTECIVECQGCFNKKVEADLKMKHVEQVIKVLGLDHIQDDIVGTPESRGVSGGQKKRVNIGCELVAMPSVVFMDEPTSGLDGAATLELAQTLVELQKAGLTICCVIHQPRMSVFKSFSHTLLLGKGGKQVYCGRTELMKTYLGSLGFWMPPEENPADWMIDVVCGLPNAPHYTCDTSEYKDQPPPDNLIDPAFTAPEGLCEMWEQGHKATCRDLESTWMKGSPLNVTDRQVVPLEKRDVPNRCAQFCTLLRRVFRQHSMKTFAFISAGLFICFTLLYAGLAKGEYTYVGIWETGNNPLYSLMAAALGRRIFGDQHLIYYRECKTGISSSAYWLSKILYSAFMGYLFSLMTTVAIYYAKIPMQDFGEMFDMYFMIYWYWAGAAMFLSCAISTQSTVTLILVLWPMLEGLYDGSIPDLSGEIKDMSGVGLAMNSISQGRWTRQMYMAAELKSLPEHVKQFPEVTSYLINKDICSAAEIAAKTCDTEAAYGEAWVYLLLIGACFRMAALLLLALVKHAQGNGFITDIVFVVSSTIFSWFECCGFVGLLAPDPKDVDLEGYLTEDGGVSTSKVGVAIEGTDSLPPAAGPAST